MALNLARDPFHNLRPVRRAGIALAVLGLVLAVVDARIYWRHFTGENQTRVRSQELDRAISAERQALARHRETLAGLEVASLNQRAHFVNEQIAQRTFSWSGLFDDLVSIQPLQVQIVSLDPNFESGRRSQRELALEPGEVLLEIDGLARDTERLLRLIDRFFSHPAFRAPDLRREAQKEAVIDFTLTVIYRPASDEAAVPEESEAPSEPAETESAAETAAADPAAPPEEAA